jgi:hypothetical protein
VASIGLKANKSNGGSLRIPKYLWTIRGCSTDRVVKSAQLLSAIAQPINSAPIIPATA